MGREHEHLKQFIEESVVKGMQNFDKPDDLASYVTSRVMDEIYENFRSITEIHGIVDAVRLGMRVQVDYYNEELDDDEYAVRQAW